MAKVKCLPEYKGKLHIGCLNCSTASRTLDPKRRLCVGFGFAALMCDEKIFWSERPNSDYNKCLSVRQATNRVKKDPDHDWRIILDTPLHGEEFQWQGDKWVLVKSDQGFA